MQTTDLTITLLSRLTPCSAFVKLLKVPANMRACASTLFFRLIDVTGRQTYLSPPMLCLLNQHALHYINKIQPVNFVSLSPNQLGQHMDLQNRVHVSIVCSCTVKVL